MDDETTVLLIAVGGSPDNLEQELSDLGVNVIRAGIADTDRTTAAAATRPVTLILLNIFTFTSLSGFVCPVLLEPGGCPGSFRQIPHDKSTAPLSGIASLFSLPFLLFRSGNFPLPPLLFHSLGKRQEQSTIL